MSSPESVAPDPAALGASMAQTMPPVTGATATPAPSAETPPAPPAAPASSEVDAKGRPFDPTKFLVNRETGRPKIDARGNYIPKSPGRYGRNGEKRPRPQPPGQAATTAPELFATPDAASQSSASSSASAAPSLPSSLGGGAGSYIPPESELPPPPSSTQSAPGASSAPKIEAAPEPEAGADDVAEVACDLLAEALGHMTGAPEEAEPSAKERARLNNVLGAYLRSKGIQTRGLGAVVLAFFAWLLRTAKKPKTRAWVRGQFAGKGSKPAPADVIDIEPRKASPAPAQAIAPAPETPPTPPPERGPAAYPVTLARR